MQVCLCLNLSESPLNTGIKVDAYIYIVSNSALGQLVAVQFIYVISTISLNLPLNVHQELVTDYIYVKLY